MADEVRGGGTPQPTLVPFTRDGRAKPPAAEGAPQADWTTGGIQPLEPQRTPRGPLVGGLVSLAWGGAVAAYGALVVGPERLLALTPVEVAALTGAVFAPLAFLWLIVAFTERGALLRSEAEALRRHLALLTYPAEAAEGRIATVSDALRAQTRELAQATREAGTHAEALRQLLNRETTELRALNAALGGETAESLQTVTERVAGLSEVAERVSALSRDMDQALARQQTALEGATDRAGREADRLGGVLRSHAEGLSKAAGIVARQVEATDTVVTRQAALLENAAATTQAFTAAAESLSAKVGAAIDGLARNIAQLREEKEKVSGRAAVLAADLRGSLEQVTALAEDVTRRASSLEDVTRRVAETSHAAAQELDSATAAALGDFNAFRDASAEALEGARIAAAAIRDTVAQGENVRRMLHTQARGLEQSVKSLGEQVRGTGLALDEQSQAIHQTSERAAERIRHLAELFSRNAVDITRTTARAVVEIETVSEGLKAGGSDVRSVVGALQEAGQVVERVVDASMARVGQVRADMEDGRQAVKAAIGDFSAAGDRIANLANDTVQALSSLADELRGEATGMARAADGAMERAEGLREQIDTLLIRFEDGVSRGAGEVNRAGERLRLAAEVFEATAVHAGGAMAERADELEARFHGLERAAAQARAGVEEATGALGQHTEMLDAAGRRGVENARKAVAELARHAEQIIALIKAAEQRAKDLDTVRDSIDVQKFLTETSYVLERLQATAVDIARLFTPAVEEDLWRRYYKGEQNVFLHHAAKTITRTQSAAVKKLFAQNSEFRAYAERYMSEYEALLRAARANDRADILTAVFTSSDMGRLYVVLARSVGRGGGQAAAQK